jgi:hypothetical protein
MFRKVISKKSKLKFKYSNILDCVKDRKYEKRKGRAIQKGGIIVLRKRGKLLEKERKKLMRRMKNRGLVKRIRRVRREINHTYSVVC